MSPLPFTAEILHAFVPLQLRVIPQTLPPHFATYLHAPLPWHESSIPSMLPGAVPSSFPFAMSLHALAPTQPRTTKVTDPPYAPAPASDADPTIEWHQILQS